MIDLPTSPEMCLTPIEASLFIVKESHSLLTRKPSLIRRHLAECGPCQLVLAKAWMRMREDQNKVRQMVGAPQIPLLDGVLPPICFEGDHTIERSEGAKLDSSAPSQIDSETQTAPEDPAFEASMDDLIFQESDFDFDLTDMRSHESLSPISKENRSKKAPLNYAKRQLRRDVGPKQLVARWVAEQIPLRDGASIFVDAGSQCAYAWKAMAEHLRSAQMSSLSLITFNKWVEHSWWRNEQDARSFCPDLMIAGNECNASHGAFKRGDRNKLKYFRPAVVLIGTNGVDVDAARISLGFNFGTEELEDKKLLFSLSAVRRVVLLTAAKIGDPGGQALDLLELAELDSSAPIYFVTNKPAAGTLYRDLLDKVLMNMQTDQMRKKLLERQLKVYWIIVHDQEKLGFDLMEFPANCHDLDCTK